MSFEGEQTAHHQVDPMSTATVDSAECKRVTDTENAVTLMNKIKLN